MSERKAAASKIARAIGIEVTTTGTELREAWTLLRTGSGGDDGTGAGTTHTAHEGVDDTSNLATMKALL